MQYDALRRQVGDSDEIWGYLRYFIDLHRLLHSCEPRQAWKDWHRLRRAAWVERSNANSSNWNCNLYTSLEAFHVWILIEFPQLPDWLSLVMMSIWCECIFFQMVFEIQWESNCSTQQCSYCVLVGHTCVYIYTLNYNIRIRTYVRTYSRYLRTSLRTYLPTFYQNQNPCVTMLVHAPGTWCYMRICNQIWVNYCTSGDVFLA